MVSFAPDPIDPAAIVVVAQQIEISPTSSSGCYRRLVPGLTAGCRHQHLIFIAWRQMDLAPSRAAVVAARASHMPRPCAAIEAARSGVSLLSGGSAHLHLIDLRWRLRPRVFVTRRAPCAARSGRTATVVSSCWVHPIYCCCIFLVCPITDRD